MPGFARSATKTRAKLVLDNDADAEAAVNEMTIAATTSGCDAFLNVLDNSVAFLDDPRPDQKKH